MALPLLKTHFLNAEIYIQPMWLIISYFKIWSIGQLGKCGITSAVMLWNLKECPVAMQIATGFNLMIMAFQVSVMVCFINIFIFVVVIELSRHQKSAHRVHASLTSKPLYPLTLMKIHFILTTNSTRDLLLWILSFNLRICQNIEHKWIHFLYILYFNVRKTKRWKVVKQVKLAQSHFKYLIPKYWVQNPYCL